MKQLLILTTIIFSLASCSRNNSDIPAQPIKKLVKITQEFGNNTTYKYDGSGRVIEATSGDQQMNFEYAGNKVSWTIKHLSLNLIAMKMTFDLNEKGYAVSGTGFLQSTPNQQPHDAQMTFTYNDQGYLVEQSITSNGLSGATEFTWIGGNLAEAKNFSNNNYSYKTKYYYPGQIPDRTKPGGGEMTTIPGMTIFGKGNLHLAEKNEFYNSQGTMTNSSVITYKLDADGYPAERKVVNGGNVSYFFYYYQ